MNATTSHRRWLRKLARETDRARLVRARAAVREARAHKRSARARARAACARARVAFRRWLVKQRAQLKARIAALRAKLRRETDAGRARVRACCGRDERVRARAAADATIAQARAELERLLTERKRERTWTRKDSLRPAPVKASSRRAESDHNVEVNLTPDELIVWAKVKGQIKATDRMSRTEAFQHWLHDHSADVGRILADDAEQAYQRAVRDEAKERKRAHGKRSDRELATYLTSELADVPF